ncbi:MAG TPA: carboxypeptidase regulatory-like domain-containing protein, partial [bacterium]|nr:carboxypeptidase regulatory-like domain-containing protein [bacterium]
MDRKLQCFLMLCAGFFLLSSTLKAAPPAAPGDLEHTQNTTSAIFWRWDDNSNNEQGFKCYEWYYQQVGSEWHFLLSKDPVWSVNANISSYIETGLAPNTQYRRVIQAWNTDGISPSYWESHRVAYYTSIEPPAGLTFGPKGFDFWSKMARLTVKLTPPLPSNLTTTDSVSPPRYGYFTPNDSGFYIEEITTGINIANTTFNTEGVIKFDPAPPTSDGWWKYNNDYDPLPSMSGTREDVRFEHYLKNGLLTKSGTTYTCNHKWDYWCVENLEPNTPYRFRAKARNGDKDETAWCNTTEEIWTLPYNPEISYDREIGVCYNMGTKFTFSSMIPFGIGWVDHYHIKWTTNIGDMPTEEDTRWETGNWVITENRGGDWYLIVISHNKLNEISGDYNYSGQFEPFCLTLGPFKVGYDVKGKVTISGGTGSYTDVVVHCGGNTTNCDSYGRFEFLHLPPGTYDVYTELPGYRIAYPIENSGHYSIKIPDNADAPTFIKKGVDFTLAYKNTYTIAGKVTITGGPGVAPSDVTITCGSYTPVHPDSNWNYFVPGVFAGTYKVKATITSFDYEITFPSGFEYTVSVGPDATGKDFVFTYIPGTDVASISGTVKLIGGTGDPAKAIVYCKNLNSGITGQANPDHTGKYSFSNLPKGKDYQLWVKMDGYKLSRVRISDNVWSDTMTVIPVNNLQDDQQNKDFELVPISYYSVSGKVDVADGVIKSPDVKVHCDSTTDTSITFAIHPETDGSYAITSIPEGSYKIYLEIPQGYKVTNPVSTKYDVTLGPDAYGKNFLVEPIAKYSVSGKVTLSGGTCNPYEALVVCQYYNSVKKDYITFTTIPDSSGNYQFTNLVPANYTLYVGLVGYQTVYPSAGSYSITITNKDITGKDFYLVSYAIKGNVSFISPGNEPVTNVTIICSAKSNNPDIPNVYVVAHPDASGNYAFYNLVPSAKLGNPYRVEVKLAGYGCISPSTGYYDVNITSKDEVRNFILATYYVSGKLTLYSGTADLTKATVTLAKLDGKGGNEIDWIVANPEKNGQYKITGIVPGSYYRVRVKLEGYYSLKPKEGGLNWGYEVYIPPSATNLDFLMMPGTTPGGYTISGTVTVSGGSVKPEQVIVHCGDYKTYPDGYGNYYFKNLNPGTYDVYVERLGYTTTYPTSYGGHYYVVVNETIPEVTGINFTIAPEPVPTYKISGTVTLAGGTGVVTNVVVHCNDQTTNPNTNGQYSFTNLPAGSYELWVELPKYVTSNPGGSGKQTVKLYDRDVAGVDFTMQAIPTYSITGTVSMPDGDVTQVQIICSSGATVNPDAFGRYMITDLLAGT